MTAGDSLFVDPLTHQAVAVSAKLGRWVKNRKIPVTASSQHLRTAGPQVVPNLHQALSTPDDLAPAILALTALDVCFNSMHMLLGALPTDTKAFSIVDDLMSLRDEVDARFPDARARLDATADPITSRR
jgi:hypothetical protein